MKPAHRFFCHSSERMAELKDDEVALTITSPPYWNAIDYDRHTADRTQNYRTRSYSNGFGGYHEYLDLMGRIFREVLRVTRPGGFCSVVIGTVLFKAKPVPVPFDFVRQMVDGGWEFHQDIIWHKCTAGVKRAGVTIQKPFPGYYYPNIMTEYILVFRRPGPRISNDRTKEEISAGAFPINALFTKDLANNIWHIAPVPPGHLDHPCPFPEEIPFRLASLYSYPGDVVLDPFLGSGQTAKVVSQIGRRAVGYDVEPSYVSYAKRRLREPLAIRPQQLIAAFEKIAIDAPLTGPGRRNGASRGPRRARSNAKQETLFAD